MQIGQVVDFCIVYNKRRQEAEAEDEAQAGKTRTRKSRRKGTQADINAFFG